MKKKVQFLKLSVLLVLLVGVLSCKIDDIEELRLSKTEFTLDPAGVDIEKIHVTYDNDWTVTYSDWLIEVAIDKKSFSVRAEPNNGDAPRQGEIIVKSDGNKTIIKVSQNEVSQTFDRISDFKNGICSPSGVYIASAIETSPESAEFTPIRLNISTGDIKKYNVMNSLVITLDAVAEDGTLYLSNELLQSYSIDLEGEMQDIINPEGSTAASVKGVSLDGKILVGYALIDPAADLGYMYIPVKWTDGVPEYLSLPDTTASGQKMTTGGYARGCSDDGSIIYGMVAEGKTAIYWKDGKVGYIAEESIQRKKAEGSNAVYISRPQVSTQSIESSPNGKYIAFTYRDEVPIEGTTQAIVKSYAGYFNTDDGSHFIYPKENYNGATVSNDGVLTLGLLDSAGVLPMEGFVLPAGGDKDTELLSTSEWLKTTHNISADSDEIIMHFSANGNLFGFYLTSDLSVKQLMNWYLYVK